jgi:hypothetical protein
MSKQVKIIIAVLTLAVIGVVVYMLLGKKTASPTGPVSTSTTQVKTGLQGLDLGNILGSLLGHGSGSGTTVSPDNSTTGKTAHSSAAAATNMGNAPSNTDVINFAELA